MATSPILSFGTAPQNITNGGGAAQVTVDVINAMWNNSQSKAMAAISNANAAILMADPAPQLAPVVLDKSYLPPPLIDFPSMDPNNGQFLYEAENAAIMAEIQGGFDDFFTKYFPDQDFYTDAMTWCERAITQGGTGMNPAVETALWQRARARLVADSQRSADEAMNLWANRNFPLPPGVLTSQIKDINLDLSQKLAEQSRDISIKSFDQEMENVKFAVTQVLEQKVRAMAAAGDYIKTLMLGPQTAMQLAVGLSGLQNDYVKSLVGYYSAQVAALEPEVRLAITDAQLKLQAEQANLTSSVETTRSKVQAALAAAQQLATLAAGGINAIGGRASISGSDSSSV